MHGEEITFGYGFWSASTARGGRARDRRAVCVGATPAVRRGIVIAGIVLAVLWIAGQSD